MSVWLRLRSSIDFYWFVWRNFRPLLLLIVVFNVGVLLADVAGLMGLATAAPKWLLSAVLLVNLALLVADVRKNRNVRYRGLRLGELETTLPGREDGELPLQSLQMLDQDELGNAVFSIQPVSGGGHVVRSASLNATLIQAGSSDFPLHVIEGRAFQRSLMRLLRPFREDFEDALSLRYRDRKMLFNESKLALRSSFGLNPKTDPVCVAKTDYFLSVLTNELSLRCMWRDSEFGKNALIQDFRRLYPYVGISRPDGGVDYKLLELESSSLSNHVGVSSLAFTADGYPVVWRQHKRAQQNGGFLVPTGSGSVDWEDLKNSGSEHLLDLVRYAMARELVEESSLAPVLGRTARRRRARASGLAERTRVIGYFRWMERGAKPEFTGITRLLQRRDELTANEVEVVGVREGGGGFHAPRVQRASDLESMCDLLLNQSNEPMSLPLRVILTDLEAHVRGGDGELVEWLFAQQA